MDDKVITLKELRLYAGQGKTLEDVMMIMEQEHLTARIFVHEPALMQGQRFLYFVIPLEQSKAKGAE